MSTRATLGTVPTYLPTNLPAEVPPRYRFTISLDAYPSSALYSTIIAVWLRIVEESRASLEFLLYCQTWTYPSFPFTDQILRGQFDNNALCQEIIDLSRQCWDSFVPFCYSIGPSPKILASAASLS